MVRHEHARYSKIFTKSTEKHRYKGGKIWRFVNGDGVCLYPLPSHFHLKSSHGCKPQGILTRIREISSAHAPSPWQPDICNLSARLFSFRLTKIIISSLIDFGKWLLLQLMLGWLGHEARASKWIVIYCLFNIILMENWAAMGLNFCNGHFFVSFFVDKMWVSLSDKGLKINLKFK